MIDNYIDSIFLFIHNLSSIMKVGMINVNDYVILVTKNKIINAIDGNKFERKRILKNQGLFFSFL